MESQFRALDVEIEAQPLPAPYDKWRCLITCNDCSAKDNVPFHFLGLKCENCKSYNTSQVRILRPEDGVDDAGNSRILPVVPLGPTRTRSSNSLVAQPLSSPPRFARAEAGPAADGERTLREANRVIAAADEAIEIAVALETSHGDGDLIFDDGWETEDDGSDMFSDNELDEGEGFELTKLDGGAGGGTEGDGGDPVLLVGHR